MKKPALVTTFPNPTEAEIACGRLKADGIEYSMQLNSGSGAFMYFGESGKAMDVFVDETDLEKARESLGIQHS